MSQKLYTPQKVLVSQEAKLYPLTNEIIHRIKKLNKNVEIKTIKTNQPRLPRSLKNKKQIRKYLDETIVLSVRSKQAHFMEVFASPGRISENLGMIGKPISMCPLGCPFCYLQPVARSVPWTRIYVNMDRFKYEWVKEEYVFRLAQTLWTFISKVQNKTIDKAPKVYKDICDKKIRKVVLSPKNIIGSDKDAIDFLKNNITDFLKELEINISNAKLVQTKKNISKWYKQNQDIALSINVSEYSDLLGLDHLTHFTDLFLDWMEENPKLEMKFRSKAPYLKNILNHKDLSRIKVTVDVNTEKHIKKYQPLGFSLQKRINAINTLTKRGARVCLAIEPIIKYPNYEKDYKKLINKLEREIDLNKIEDIKIGCVRYKTRLKNYIADAQEKTDLLNDYQDLQEPEPIDKRWRYTKKERINIYNTIIDALPQKNKDLIILGSENPEIWDEVGLDRMKIHTKEIVQS